MPFPLLEARPLYENEDLKEGSIPTVTPIEQVRDEGNCGEVTNRGEEAFRMRDRQGADLTSVAATEIKQQTLYSLWVVADTFSVIANNFVQLLSRQVIHAVVIQ